MIKFLFCLLLICKAHAFYLITNNGAAFNSSKVNIYITSNSTCSNTGWSKTDLLEMAQEGAKDTWNKVGRADIEVKAAGEFTATNTDFLNGELCVADSDTTCAAGTIPKVNNIVITCNNNGTNFPSNSVLAISAPNNISGSKIKGSIIVINNRADSQLSTFSKGEMQKILAHEIGHALGIGHSKDSAAFMYHKDIQNKNGLARDDIYALSHLYPKKLDDMSCLGFLGSIENQSNNNYWNKPLLVLSIGFLSIILVLQILQTLLGYLSNASVKV